MRVLIYPALASLAALAVAVSACSNPPAGEGPLFDDTAFDAAEVEVSSETIEVEPNPATPVRINEAVLASTTLALPSSQGEPAAVLPEADGVIIFVRHDEDAGQPWRVLLWDLTTDETLEVYRGVREVQSVAIDGRDTAVLAARQEAGTTSDLEIFRADLDAGTITRLTDNDVDERNVSVNTDGSLVAWDSEPASDERVVIWRDPSDDSEYRLSHTGSQLEPSLSGDGDYLAFVTAAPDGWEVGLLHLETETATSVGVSGNRLRHPSPADGGGEVAWVEEAPGEDVVRVWEEGTNQVTREFENEEEIRHLHLADSGRWLAYSVPDANGDLRLHTRDREPGGGEEAGPAGSGEDLTAYWRLSYQCTVTAASAGSFRPAGLTCDSE